MLLLLFVYFCLRLFLDEMFFHQKKNKTNFALLLFGTVFGTSVNVQGGFGPRNA